MIFFLHYINHLFLKTLHVGRSTVFLLIMASITHVSIRFSRKKNVCMEFLRNYYIVLLVLVFYFCTFMFIIIPPYHPEHPGLGLYLNGSLPGSNIRNARGKNTP